MLVFESTSFYPRVRFGIRWFSEHKFAYIDGVRPSRQLDLNFWLCMGCLCPSLLLMLAGAISCCKPTLYRLLREGGFIFSSAS